VSDYDFYNNLRCNKPVTQAEINRYQVRLCTHCQQFYFSQITGPTTTGLAPPFSTSYQRRQRVGEPNQETPNQEPDKSLPPEAGVD
jgi:hypothetical protein